MNRKGRMLDEFIELVKIDSLSLQERQMADRLKSKLEALGLTVVEDETGTKIGGNSGNLLCNIKGEKDVPAILLMAHMDTVVPGLNKQPMVEGNMIKSSGTTILGGDDVAGIVCILEALRTLQENKISHGDIQIAFTVAEEIGLLGAKNLDYGKITAKYGFVMDDGGRIGNVAVKAPSQNKIEIIVCGKAAHAGVEPEKGISAIQIAAEAIFHMKLGRIDEETTANIGIINGGTATNIICDQIQLQGESRSRDEQKLQVQTNHMRQCFEEAAKKFGGKLEFNSEIMYPSYNIKESDGIVSILKEAVKAANLELKLEATGGGSDTNILNGQGIQAVDISVGMEKVHSVEEQICIDDMVKAAQFLVEIIKSVDN